MEQRGRSCQQTLQIELLKTVFFAGVNKIENTNLLGVKIVIGGKDKHFCVISSSPNCF